MRNTYEARKRTFSPKEYLPQLKLTGQVKPTQVGGEMITFKIPMGPLGELICIVNIPHEGEETAPVYVKIKAGPPRS